MNKRFQALVEQILEFRWKANPVDATYSGIHKYDGQFENFSPAFRRSYHNKLKGFSKKLKRFYSKKEKLSEGELLDLEILYSTLETEVKYEKVYNRFMRDASFYPSLALSGCNVFIIRDFAPPEQRGKSLWQRLKQIPAFLKQGERNLKKVSKIPRIWTEIGMETTMSGKTFFQTSIPEFAEKVPQLKSSILKAAQEAEKSFERYYNFLKEKVLPKSRGDVAGGKNVFDNLLSSQHQLPYDTKDLLKIGKKVIRNTQDELKIISKRIDPGKSWSEILTEIKKLHPDRKNLLNFYKEEMMKSYDFVKSKELVTLPEEEELEVIETPVFVRHLIPYAAYMSPAPFEKTQKGFYWVTPVDQNLPVEKQEQQLQGHNVFKSVVTTLHEGYPGHHLQLVLGNRIDSKVRRVFGTTVFVEGWALYCEEMMYEQGYYTDIRTRLFQLKDQLWRGCRVVIDVKLHTKKMSFNQAVDMLVNVAKLERVNAIAEVKRYTQEPTQPMSYVIGKLEVLKVRDEYKKLKGKEFDLKKFHDQLLSYGSIPVKLVREKMLARYR
ncbi:MAG: DUF885 domain-containing protein [candidate division Zixibacteria bacterium]|nr:DUF885 domain-containing protein [candidate division Zixibacteria bacterium]